MKLPASLLVIKYFLHIQLLVTPTFVLIVALVPELRDAFGYFFYVILGFSLLFLLLQIKLCCNFRDMIVKSKTISRMDFGSSDRLYDGGQTAQLNQGFARDFTRQFGIIFLLKLLLSLLFMCQYLYAGDMAQKNSSSRYSKMTEV